jgi:hypothetical protein
MMNTIACVITAPEDVHTLAAASPHSIWITAFADDDGSRAAKLAHALR